MDLLEARHNGHTRPARGRTLRVTTAAGSRAKLGVGTIKLCISGSANLLFQLMLGILLNIVPECLIDLTRSFIRLFFLFFGFSLNKQGTAEELSSPLTLHDSGD